MIRKAGQITTPSRATESRKMMNAWTNAVLDGPQSRQGGGPRTPLYSAKATEAAEDAAAPARGVPPAPQRPIRRTRPVTFLCIGSPGLALGLPSGGVHVFEDGHLTLTDPRDIAAVRHHGWYGSRIVEDTPEVLAQIEAQAELHRQVRQHQQALAEEAMARRRIMGPKSFGPPG